MGDHGSVTLYGAAAGTPLLLAAFGGDAVPGTAVHDLAAVAPRLDPRGDLRQQVEDVVRAHTPDRYAAVAARAFSEPGHALARLRTALYRLLKLPEPSSPPPAPLLLPDPDPPLAPITSWQVTTGVTGNSTAPAISVRRIPAAVTAYGTTPPDSATLFTHLACADDERDPRLTESASVIVRRQAAPTAVGAVRWTEDTLAQLPGSLLAASAMRGGGCLVGLRDGTFVETASTGPAPDPGLHAAVVYACLRAGLPLDDAQVTLRIGGMRDEDVILRLRPAPPNR